MLLELPQLLVWGLEVIEGVSVGVGIFNALDHTFILFHNTVFPSGVCITRALSNTWVTIEPFHDLVLACGLAWCLTGFPTDVRESFAFIRYLIAWQWKPFSQPKFYWSLCLTIWSWMDNYLATHMVLGSWHLMECSYSLIMLSWDLLVTLPSSLRPS